MRVETGVTDETAETHAHIFIFVSCVTDNHSLLYVFTSFCTH